MLNTRTLSRMQAQQAPFFRPVQTSSYFRVNHQPAPRTTPQPQRQQQTRSNFFKPTSSQTTKQRGEYCCPLPANTSQTSARSCLVPPAHKWSSLLFTYTHTHTHTHTQQSQSWQRLLSRPRKEEIDYRPSIADCSRKLRK